MNSLCQVTCDVIYDLLPLYCDDACTQDSRMLIEEHLKNCSKCSGLLQKMKAPCRASQVQERRDEEIIKNMANAWRVSISKSFRKGAFLACTVCLLLLGGYLALKRWPAAMVPQEAVRVTVDATERSLTVHTAATDGKKVLSFSRSVTGDGRMFIVLKRGLLPVRNGNGENFSNSYTCPRIPFSDQGEKVRIKEIYYGTEKSHKLVWQENE